MDEMLNYIFESMRRSERRVEWGRRWSQILTVLVIAETVHIVICEKKLQRLLHEPNEQKCSTEEHTQNDG